MTLYVAHHTAHSYGNIRSVYASRFGEWEKTVKQLEMYHYEKELSPAGFGLSVHNAAIGMFSLLDANTKSYTSISGCEHSFDAGLIEAVTTLIREDKVLFVSSDERVPDLYKSNFPEKLNPLAVGLLISKNRQSQDDIHLSIEFNAKEKDCNSNYEHTISFIKFILGDERLFIGNNYTIMKLND